MTTKSIAQVNLPLQEETCRRIYNATVNYFSTQGNLCCIKLECEACE